MKKVLIVGASGYGNVGDDSYAMLYREELKDCEVQIRNSDLPASFPPCDLMVIGGGGLLHTQSEHFEKMSWYLRFAHQNKVPFGFSSAGFQYDPKVLGVSWVVQPSECWQPWLQLAKFVTVRSPADVQRARELGVKAQFFPDLCYLMKRHIPKELHRDCKVLVIVPGAGVFRYEPDARAVIGVQELCTRRFVQGWLDSGGRLQAVRMGAAADTVIHLKRLRAAYKDIEVYEGGDPKVCMRHIAAAAQVVSGRYHGMIFARCAGVPCWTMPLAPYKIVSEPAIADPSAAIKHIQVLRRFLA